MNQLRLFKPTIRDLVFDRYESAPELFNLYDLISPICEYEGCLQDTPRREFNNLRDSKAIDCALVKGIGKKSWYRKGGGDE